MKQKEQSEIDLLLGKGFEINTVLFGRLKKWRTKKMCLGRLIELSDVFVKMKGDDEAESNLDFIANQYVSVKNNAKLSARAMAICVTDKRWLRPFLVRHFLKNISSAELLDFAQKLLNQADYKNFILSIVLMNANRVTKAETVEKEKV